MDGPGRMALMKERTETGAFCPKKRTTYFIECLFKFRFGLAIYKSIDA